MIYITGDTHGEIDISKLNSKNFPQGNSLTKDDLSEEITRLSRTIREKENISINIDKSKTCLRY